MSRKYDLPRRTTDRRSKVTRIETSWNDVHAGRCSELQRSTFALLARSEAPAVEALGFDAVRFAGMRSWILTVANDRVDQATAELDRIETLGGAA